MVQYTPRDTITANDSVLDAFQQSGNYDYARDLGDGQEVSYFDRLMEKLENLFDLNFNSWSLPDWLWWMLGVLVLIAVGYLIWRNRARMFNPREDKADVQEITEDDINDVDFDQLIDKAERDSDYLMLCQLRYLQTLKAASDASLVDWKRYKTPSQYAMEWRDEDFNIMTNHFLRIRYGHYGADAALAAEMRSRQETLLARISATRQQEQSSQQAQEGGEQP